MNSTHKLRLLPSLAILVALLLPLTPALAGGTADQETETSATPAETATSEFNYGLGIGFERFPRWLGATESKTLTIPYIKLEWQERVTFSTVEGLTIDLLHGEHWHGGIIGTLMWGRSGKDMGSLSAAVPTRNNTLQGGLYLEYALSKALSLGWRLRHDIQSTGAAYSDVYADLELPAVGYMEHSIKASIEGMNKSAMQRFFGVSQETATQLGTSSYQPGAGLSQVSLAYQAFIPTSEHTGFALAANLAKFTRTPEQSPLVQNFGSPYQRNYLLAFVVHY